MGTTPQSRGDRGMVQLVDLLEFAIEQANDGIAVMRFTGNPNVPIRIVYANATIERLSGFSRAELLDPSNPFLAVQPENRARYEALLERIRAGQSVRFEIALGGKSRATWCEIRWSPLQYAGKDVTHYVAIIREHPVEAAREPIAILTVSEDEAPQRVEFVNDAMCAMLGLSREHIFETGLGAIAGAVKGGPFTRELCLRRDDETTRWVRVEGSPVYSDDRRVERVTITCRDIDESKRKDDEVALLQSVLSHASDFIVVTDARRPSEDGPVVTYANPAFAAVVGRSPDNLSGTSLTGFIAAPSDEKTVSSLFSRLEHHAAVSLELQVRNETTGDDVWIELSGQPVRDESGSPVSWIFVGKDISVRKQSYTQTAQLLTALDLADEPIGIYGVTGRFQLELQHMNRSAATFERPLVERLFDDRELRERFQEAWHALERGENITRLVHVGDNDPRRWVRLELRPMRSAARKALSSIVAIEHTAGRVLGGEMPPEIGTMLALSCEIMRFEESAARVDAFLEVLRVEWGIAATFSPAKRELDLVLRAKERNGYMVVPAGMLFERAVAVDFTWTATFPPRRLTALRIFLETLAHSE